MRIPGANLETDLARALVLAGIFAAAGSLIGYLLVPPAPAGIDPKAPAPELVLLGQPLSLAADAADKALHVVRRYAAGSVAIKTPDGKRHEVSRATLGAEIERVRLARLVADARDPASPLRRALARHRPRGPVRLPVPVVLVPSRALAALMQLKDAVDRPAVDARLDLETRKLVPEREGIELDVVATLARLERAAREGDAEVEAVTQPIAPRLRAERLGNPTFDEVLGWFETGYARGPKHLLRTFNLRLAASRLDGHVIMPGETFDFNETVGPRDEAHGYKDAPVIAEGELVDGIGGGTCQIAGTLHGAAFFAGLEVVSRRPHTRPSSYIKMGLDAAVAYPTISLRLRNPFELPVVLHETVKDGVVRAEVLGPKRRLTVTFVRKVLEISPYEQLERPDPALASGERVLSQRGIPGFKILRQRIVRDGPFAVREHSTDSYPPTAQIVRVGRAETASAGAKHEDDAHPEYVADEYLALTQGPGIRTPGAAAEEPAGGMAEGRVPGGSGTRGWTEKAGYPQHRSDKDAAERECEPGDAVCAKKAEGDKQDAGSGKGKGTGKGKGRGKDERKKRRQEQGSDAR
jgi:vancomycin resistance protein YoaR